MNVNLAVSVTVTRPRRECICLAKDKKGKKELKFGDAWKEEEESRELWVGQSSYNFGVYGMALKSLVNFVAN